MEPQTKEYKVISGVEYPKGTPHQAGTVLNLTDEQAAEFADGLIEPVQSSETTPDEPETAPEENKEADPSTEPDPAPETQTEDPEPSDDEKEDTPAPVADEDTPADTPAGSTAAGNEAKVEERDATTPNVVSTPGAAS